MAFSFSFRLRIFAAFLLAGLALAAAADTKESSPPATKSAAPAPTLPTTAPRGSFRSVIQPAITIQLSSRAAGIIEALLVPEGAPIKKDQPLIALDAAQEKAEVAQAEAALRGANAEQERAAAELNRINRLLKENVSTTSDKNYVDAKAAAELATSHVEQAAASLQLSKVRLANRTITSPIDGILLRVPKQVGEAVDRYEIIARVVDVTSLELMIFCDAKYFSRFRAGQRMEMRVVKSAEEQPIISGVIVHIDPIIDPSFGTFRIKIKIDPSANAIPGLAAFVAAPAP